MRTPPLPISSLKRIHQSARETSRTISSTVSICLPVFTRSRQAGLARSIQFNWTLNCSLSAWSSFGAAGSELVEVVGDVVVVVVVVVVFATHVVAN